MRCFFLLVLFAVASPCSSSAECTSLNGGYCLVSGVIQRAQECGTLNDWGDGCQTSSDCPMMPTCITSGCPAPSATIQAVCIGGKCKIPEFGICSSSLVTDDFCASGTCLTNAVGWGHQPACSGPSPPPLPPLSPPSPSTEFGFQGVCVPSEFH